MRSAQTHLCAWAIMKKFIYVCNEKHYMFPLLCIYSNFNNDVKKQMQNMCNMHKHDSNCKNVRVMI